MHRIDAIDVAEDRRRFLRGTTGVMLLLVAASGGATARAAGELEALSDAHVVTLVRMARDLYPHDRVPDEDYRAAVTAIFGSDSTAAGKAMLTQGIRQIDAAAMKRTGRAYDTIEAESERIAVLRMIEGSEFFKAMRSGMITTFYNQESVWTALGYEGSSAEKGGYLKRGFNDIGWLPVETSEGS